MDTAPTSRKHLRLAGLYAAPFASFMLLVLLLNGTNPLQAGPLSILAVFVLLYALIFSTLSVLLHLVGVMIRLVRPDKPVSFRRGYYILSVIALAPVLLIALNTLGQLDVLEGALIFLLVGLGCFYVVRRTTN